MTTQPLLVTLGACARSGLRKAEPPEGPVPRCRAPPRSEPAAQLAEKVPCELLMARNEPMAQASLPEMRAAHETRDGDGGDDPDDRHDNQ